MHPDLGSLEASRRGCVRQRGGHCPSEIGIGEQSGELGFPLRLGCHNETPYLLIWRDAKWPNTGPGLGCIVGERQHGKLGALGNWRDRSCFRGRQWPEDEAVAFGHRRLGSRCGARGGSPRIQGIQRRSTVVLQSELRRLEQDLPEVRSRPR
jgi:hypothetical protein